MYLPNLPNYLIIMIERLRMFDFQPGRCPVGYFLDVDTLILFFPL